MTGPLTAGEALRRLIDSADVYEAEARKQGVWDDGAIENVIRGIQQYRPSLDAARSTEGLPRLWWCGYWGTLNEQRYHGNDGPCDSPRDGDGPVTCGQVAYVRDADLRALGARLQEKGGTE